LENFLDFSFEKVSRFGKPDSAAKIQNIPKRRTFYFLKYIKNIKKLMQECFFPLKITNKTFG
jgi:hypothetical protein